MSRAESGRKVPPTGGGLASESLRATLAPESSRRPHTDMAAESGGGVGSVDTADGGDSDDTGDGGAAAAAEGAAATMLTLRRSKLSSQN
jgi:hypothetical protein